MRIKNPYKRIEEIDEELKPLEEKEGFYKNKRITSKRWKERRDFDEVKSSIFFLVMERNIIRQTIDYFEKPQKHSPRRSLTEEDCSQGLFGARDKLNICETTEPEDNNIKGLKVIDGTPTAISNYLSEREKDKGCVSCKYYGTDDDGFEYCAYETLVNSGNLEEIPKERTCKDFKPKCEDKQ